MAIELNITIDGPKLEAGVINATNIHNAEQRSKDPDYVDKTPPEYCGWVLVQAAKGWAIGVVESDAQEVVKSSTESDKEAIKAEEVAMSTK